MNTTTLIAADLINEQIRKTHININNELLSNYIHVANEKFNIPTGDVMDYISGRSKIENAPTLIVYILTYCFDETCGTDLVKQIFTNQEIRVLKNEKYTSGEDLFPIYVECVQVASDQFIGKCDANFLMKLRDAQLINYNTNAQRTLQRMIRYGIESYRIAINKGALASIKKALLDGDFIPNTITLNIPEDEVDWKYDDSQKRLKINKIKHFDIADGYHRYLAICQIKDEHPEFNYPMELRIVYFPDSKIKQFIYQEDQKTKMKKIDSDSMNMNAPENLVTERLNRDPMFFYKGGISHGNGVINYSEFAACVKYFYFQGKTYTASERAMAVNDVKNELLDKLNSIFPIDGVNKFDFKTLTLIFACLNEGYGKDVITKCIANKNDFVFTGRRLRKGIVSDIVKEIKRYV